MIPLAIPLRTVSAANSREHWAAKARRVKAERAAVALCWPMAWRRKEWKWPIEVALTRQAPRELDEGDNLPSSLKACRDECAKLLGIDDRDPRVCWVYDQTKSKEYGVEIKVTEMGP